MKRKALSELIKIIESLREENEKFDSLTLTYRSKVHPATKWEQAQLEVELGLQLPPDLIEFWNLTSGMRLFEEIHYRQWGLILWSAAEVMNNHKNQENSVCENLNSSDLVIGEFKGDLDLVVMRCDPKAGDYGHILIADAIDPRREWDLVADSLREFLERYLESPKVKYWSTSNQT